MNAHRFTVYDMLARGAAVHGPAPAVIEGDREISFRDLLGRVDALAGGLARLGLAKGDRVCILAQNDAAYLDLYGACARQGIVAYPINWRLTAGEVQRVVERAAPAMMIIDASTAPVVAEWAAGRRAVRHWHAIGAAAVDGVAPLSTLYATSAPEPPDVSPEDAFAVISTAAVDTVPRGAVLTHANVLAADLTIMATVGGTAEDRYLAAL